MIRLICALGNPGREYALTRHNYGWMLLARWRPDADWSKKFKGEYATIHDPRKLILVKPLTLMNLSGESLRAAADFFNIEPEEILILHDDLELPFGQIEPKLGGGLGGHNGLKSIKQHLGTPDFRRLRLGIGRPRHGSVSNHVLSRFSKEEEMVLETILDRGVNKLIALL